MTKETHTKGSGSTKKRGSKRSKTQVSASTKKPASAQNRVTARDQRSGLPESRRNDRNESAVLEMKIAVEKQLAREVVVNLETEQRVEPRATDLPAVSERKLRRSLDRLLMAHGLQVRYASKRSSIDGSRLKCWWVGSFIPFGQAWLSAISWRDEKCAGLFRSLHELEALARRLEALRDEQANTRPMPSIEMAPKKQTEMLHCSGMSTEEAARMSIAERWQAANSPLELHADPYQIVQEGVHAGTMSGGEWGQRFCLHLFPDASSLECISGRPLPLIEATFMLMFGRFRRRRGDARKHIAATEWMLLAQRWEERHGNEQ